MTHVNNRRAILHHGQNLVWLTSTNGSLKKLSVGRTTRSCYSCKTITVSPSIWTSSAMTVNEAPSSSSRKRANQQALKFGLLSQNLKMSSHSNNQTTIKIITCCIQQSLHFTRKQPSSNETIPTSQLRISTVVLTNSRLTFTLTGLSSNHQPSNKAHFKS